MIRLFNDEGIKLQIRFAFEGALLEGGGILEWFVHERVGEAGGTLGLGWSGDSKFMNSTIRPFSNHIFKFPVNKSLQINFINLGMRDLHKTRETNITMFGKPVNIKEIKHIRLGQGSQAETMSSARDPDPTTFKKHSKWVSYNDPQEYQKQKPVTNSTIYNLPLKFSQQEPLFSNNFIGDKETTTDAHWNKLYTPAPEIPGKNMFNLHYVIGKGGFGKVWKVDNKKTGKTYAMKEMYKTKIIQKKSIDSVMNERKLLCKLKHPFLVNMTYAFQDKENLYLVMDFLNGGDLRYHIGVKRRFSETETKFFVACIVLGLSYLHSHRIIHRDIKPENLVMESNGYIRITDLGVSREWKEDNSHNTSGTPGYMAPEVMCHKNHGFAADYFAVGVLAYEFMLGKRPYLGKNRKQIRDQILSKQASIKMEDIPRGWSPQAADFINKLLLRNPNNRLGNNGFDQVKKHPWMRNVDFARLLKKQVKSPYIPLTIEQNYQQFKHQISQDTIVDNPEENAFLLRDPDVQNLFDGYQFPEQEQKRGKLSTTTSSSLSSELNNSHRITSYRKYLDSSRK